MNEKYKKLLSDVNAQYGHVSGKARKYVDNTIDFINTAIKLRLRKTEWKWMILKIKK